MNLDSSTNYLTPKEKEIIQLLATGKMYKEIATIQNVKLDTIKKHATTVYKKLGVRNKTEALLKISTQKL